MSQYAFKGLTSSSKVNVLSLIGISAIGLSGLSNASIKTIEELDRPTNLPLIVHFLIWQLQSVKKMNKVIKKKHDLVFILSV